MARELGRGPVTGGFSVVIPSRDRPEDLSTCLRSVREADNGRLREIVVVDDGSRTPAEVDGTFGPVRVHLFRNDTPVGPDKSRNEAARIAKADYLVFLDDDARMAHDWFYVASRMIDQGVPAFTGRVLPFDRGLSSRARQWRYDQRYARVATGQPVRFFAGGNSVVERELFLHVGGFPVLTAGGDNGIVARLENVGTAITFVRELRILHRNGKGLRAAAERAWSSGRAVSAAMPAEEIIRDCARSLRRLREAPADVAMVNGVLQVVHSTAQLMPGSNSQFHGGRDDHA
jgi:glycosyltransferase involved in cell wall biosynthesis